MSAYQYAIVGSSGKGKTMTFRNMDTNVTGFINAEGKAMPLKDYKIKLGI